MGLESGRARARAWAFSQFDGSTGLRWRWRLTPAIQAPPDDSSSGLSSAQCREAHRRSSGGDPTARAPDEGTCGGAKTPRRRAVPRTVTGRATEAGSIYNRPYATLNLLRHLDRARAVGLLGVARRAGPEARQALDAGAGPALGVRAAAVRELLALVAPARTEPFRSKTASKSEKRPPTAVSPGDDAFQWSETAADPQIREIQDTELRTRRRSRRGPARR